MPTPECQNAMLVARTAKHVCEILNIFSLLNRIVHLNLNENILLVNFLSYFFYYFGDLFWGIFAFKSEQYFCMLEFCILIFTIVLKIISLFLLYFLFTTLIFLSQRGSISLCSEEII